MFNHISLQTLILQLCCWTSFILLFVFTHLNNCLFWNMIMFLYFIFLRHMLNVEHKLFHFRAILDTFWLPCRKPYVICLSYMQNYTAIPWVTSILLATNRSYDRKFRKFSVQIRYTVKMSLKFHFAQHFQLCPQGGCHNDGDWNIIPCEHDSRISNLDVWLVQRTFYSFRHTTRCSDRMLLVSWEVP